MEKGSAKLTILLVFLLNASGLLSTNVHDGAGRCVPIDLSANKVHGHNVAWTKALPPGGFDPHCHPGCFINCVLTECFCDCSPSSNPPSRV